VRAKRKKGWTGQFSGKREGGLICARGGGIKSQSPIPEDGPMEGREKVQKKSTGRKGGALQTLLMRKRKRVEIHTQ